MKFKRLLAVPAVLLAAAVPASAHEHWWWHHPPTPPPRVACTSAQDRLTTDKTGVEVTCLPAGTAYVGVAVMKTLAGPADRYYAISASQKVYVPPAGEPVVDVQADSSQGRPIGDWAGRKQTEPAGHTEEPPAEESHEAERHEKEAAEKAQHEREAKERAEREARERAEREQREREAAEEAEQEVPAEEAPTGLRPGIDSGFSQADFEADQKVGGHLVRLEFSLNESNLASNVESVIKEVQPYGLRVQPLFGFAGRTPSTSESAGQLAAVAKAVGPGYHFEFGNETSFGYQYGDGYSDASYKTRARNYAFDVKAAAEAVKPYGDGVLAQAEDGGSGSSVWVDEMFAAVPNLSSYVAGWTIHPYSGQKSSREADTYGVPKMERMVADLAKHGDTTTPIDVTEWGEPSENGTTLSDGKHLTFAEAAEVVEHQIPQLKAAAKAHPIDSFIVYQDRDQRVQGTDTEREHYFGILTTTLGAKGAYTTAIEKFLAS